MTVHHMEVEFWCWFCDLPKQPASRKCARCKHPVCKACFAEPDVTICRECYRKTGGAKQDAVNHPSHYNTGQFEVIDVIEDWSLNFNLGNAVKYIARCDHKGKPLEDLRKAVWYLQREIRRREHHESS